MLLCFNVFMYSTLTSIILSRETFHENDLLITTYTQEKGKVILQARGAKKILSKLAGHLEPVSLSSLEITIGKNIDQLIGANLINPYKKIKADVTKIGYANYFSELVNEFTHPNHPDLQIFNLLQKSLDYLNNNSNNYPIARISFGYKLLHLLGFNPAPKTNPKLGNDINFVVKNPISKIIINKKVISNLKDLNKILDQEIHSHLDKNLNSSQFLGKIITKSLNYHP